MSIVEPEVPPLRMGDFLSRDEFLRRWEAMPGLKFAELLGGVVYMPSPLSGIHGETDNNVAGWLAVYKAFTPGCSAANHATWLMVEGAPQPDTSLWVKPEYGGTAGLEGRLLKGVPGFLAEVCLTSAAYDLHPKLDLYEEGGVQEYLAVLLHERAVRWHRLTPSGYEVIPQPADGVYRSGVFPGLWLDAPALLSDDLARVLTVLQQGLASTEHQTFVQQLASRRAGC